MSKRKREERVTSSSLPQVDSPPARRDGAARELVLVCVAVVVLAGAVWAVYGRALDVPFIFDDRGSIVENSSIRTLWPLLGSAEHPGPLRPPAPYPMAGRPLVNLTLAFDSHWSQLDPRGFHRSNIWLHVLVALLVFATVRRTLRLPYFDGRLDRAAGSLALAVALLWALHPLQSEAVVYVTQRTELMVALFCLATLYSSLRYWAATTRGGRATWLALAVLASLAGMASKEVMVTAPVVVLLFERAFVTRSFRRAWQQSWPLYVGLAATWLLLLALNYSSPRGDTAGFHIGVPVSAWWLTQSKVLWMYLRLAVWPWPLAIHYEMPYLDTIGAAWPWLLGVALLVIGVAILLWRNHTLGFVGAWVLLILSPTLVVPIITEVAAERRMYLPLVALVSLVVVCGYWLLERVVRRVGQHEAPAATGRTAVLVGGSAALILVLTAGVVSAHRLAVYRDELSLWQDTVASQPLNSMAYYNLGIELAERHRLTEAIDCYRRAIELKPDYYKALYNLANLLAQTGRSEEAVVHYRRALEIDPDSADAHFNLGLALANGEDVPQGIAEMELALQIRPDDADFHAHYAQVLARIGRTSEALAHFDKAVQDKPDDAVIARGYGASLLQAGRFDEAIDQYQRALRFDPENLHVYAGLCEAYIHTNQADRAISSTQEAIRIARASGQTELADELESWLADYRAKMIDSDSVPASGGAPPPP
jgi:tetratricopeptide (TPR) repeat protein